MVNERIDFGRLIGAADVESVAVRRRRRGVPVPQPDEIAAALARNLRDLRRARQLSLKALAGLAGVSPGMLLQMVTIRRAEISLSASVHPLFATRSDGAPP